MRSLSQLHFLMLEPGVTERVHITLLCSNTRFADLDLILGNVSPPFMFKANYLLAQKNSCIHLLFPEYNCPFIFYSLPVEYPAFLYKDWISTLWIFYLVCVEEVCGVITLKKFLVFCHVVVVLTFDPSTKGGRNRRISLSSNPAWSADRILERLQSYRETLSQKKNNNF